MKLNTLTEEEKAVIVDKATQAPFVGEYDKFFKEGVYVCRQCDNPLFDSRTKFDAGCGWPAFDDHFKGAERVQDRDDRRVEIACATCGGHLGHVFEGERFTDKDTRHCVNSLSIKFVPKRDS